MRAYCKIFIIYLGCGLVLPFVFGLIAGSLRDALYIYNFILEEVIFRNLSATLWGDALALVIRLFFTASFAFLGTKRFKTGLLCELGVLLLNIAAAVRMLTMYHAP
jgi:hypothetical protein